VLSGGFSRKERNIKSFNKIRKDFFSFDRFKEFFIVSVELSAIYSGALLRDEINEVLFSWIVSTLLCLVGSLLWWILNLRRN
jgi:hypothetical protein